MYRAAFDLSVRLLAGEVLDLVDEHGRRWRASATSLSWVLAGEAAPIIEGSAADVAIEVLRRRLVVRSVASAAGVQRW